MPGRYDNSRTPLETKRTQALALPSFWFNLEWCGINVDALGVDMVQRGRLG